MTACSLSGGWQGHTLVEVGQVVAQDVAEAAELCSALVGEAELECARGCHGVQRLQSRVVSQDVQHTTVCLPQELEPGRHLLPVCAVLCAHEHTTLHQSSPVLVSSAPCHVFISLPIALASVSTLAGWTRLDVVYRASVQGQKSSSCRKRMATEGAEGSPCPSPR